MESLLVKLISQDHKLKQSGKYLKGVEHDSLVIDLEKDLFFWNSRHLSGDAIGWLMHVKGYTFADAKRLVMESGDSDQFVYTVIERANGSKVTVYPKLVDTLWNYGKDYREYWYKRGLSDSIIDRFRLGYYDGWYLIPFFMDSSFLNFQMRRDEPEKRIKNWYSGVGPILFNSSVLSLTNSIIITESPTDALVLIDNGYPNTISHNGGSGFWSTDLYKYFIQQKEIFVVYDNDEAGVKGARKVARALGEMRCRVFTFDGFPSSYDTGKWFLDNKGKDFGELLEERARFIFE